MSHDGDPGLAPTMQAPPPADPELARGTLVGDYVIEEPCGRGGFATVYRARHVTSERAAAVKVLHSWLATAPTLLRRFRREVALVQRLRHPGIVELYDVMDTSDGRPAFAMEWLDGGTLEEQIRVRGSFGAADAVRVMEAVCPALALAHENGIIHRDLKAANVMAVPEGDWFRFVLLDFGIAKLLDPSATHNLGLTGTALTTVGMSLGSPYSMAPEQILERPVDARTDVYALGVLLYELLAGRPPFSADSAAELEDKHLDEVPPAPSALDRRLAAFDPVVARCLAKDPDDRFASAGELLDALRGAVSS